MKKITEIPEATQEELDLFYQQHLKGSESNQYYPDSENGIVAMAVFSTDWAMRVLEEVRSEHFFSQFNKTMMSAVESLIDSGQDVDGASLLAELNRTGSLPDEIRQGLWEYGHYPITNNLEYHAKKVRDAALLRKMVNHIDHASKLCQSANGNTAEIVDRIQQGILAVSIGEKASQDIKSLCEQQADRYEYLANLRGKPSGIGTGFRLIDKITSGFQDHDLIILAARPSMGKTALTLNCAINIAKSGHRVGFFSLEMAGTQLIDRAVSAETGINSAAFKSGLFRRGDINRAMEALSNIQKLPLDIDDTSGISIGEIRRRARRMKKKGMQIMFIDYLQLIRGGSSRSRNEEISNITGELKNIARELKIPVVCLSQLNRDLEKRSNKRPQLSDLRDSGSVEQDSDVVMFIYREEVYFPEQNRGVAEINFAKHRTGPQGIVKLGWNGATTQFYDLEI